MSTVHVHNLTRATLLAYTLASATSGAELTRVPVPPLSVAELPVYKRRKLSLRRRHVRLSCGDGKEFDVALDWSTADKAVSMVENDSLPLTVYRYKESAKLQRLLVLPKRDMSTFLSHLDDKLSLAELCLPGTHDTMAFHNWPFLKCQSRSTPLADQLQKGIRVLDIRLGMVNNRLIAFHANSNQKTPFQEILLTVYAFLNNPGSSRETVVMSIMQEDSSRTTRRMFSMAVRDEILESDAELKMWFLENRVPNLGEVRGKVVMFSRFGEDGDGWKNGLEGMGIHPPTWPDSEKSRFAYQLKETSVRTQDWYAISTPFAIPEKARMATAMLVPPESVKLTSKLLNITYLSANSMWRAPPRSVALGFGFPRVRLGLEGVNVRVSRWLIQQLVGVGTVGHGESTNEIQMHEGKGEHAVAVSKISGWMLMDFFTEPKSCPIVPLFVEFNFLRRARV